MLRSRVLVVVAGAPNRLKVVTDQTLNVPICDIFVPTNYTVFNTNNIALMELAYDLPSANKHIGIINLPTQPPATDLTYRVLGWGRVYKGGPLASRILFIDVNLQKRNVCESLIENFKPAMLCAGNLNSSEDENPCPGDSGDPLLLNLTIYGIATYGLGCGYGYMPSVYTDVWYHMGWINEVLKQNLSPKYQFQPHYMFLLLIMLIIAF
ncbi:trypsin alpha-3-like isoform X2 [Drosophila montana]|uniref:trypsin alpha-3-like isoform X2 n=2 Tax=Drosophila montana TaxID=40370 RepID=UPI00313C2D86